MPDTSDPSQVLDRLLEAVPGGVVHVGAEGAVLRANPEATRFLGLAYDELTQRYTVDFEGDTWFEDGLPCPASDYPVTIALVERRRAGPTTIGVGQPDGTVRWAVFRAVPVEGGGAVVTFLDITERRAFEQRLRTSDRLASLGRLAAGVAHEINNPLTWMSLNIEQALAGDDVERALRSALEGVSRVASIVRDLSTFARHDEASHEAFDLAASVRRAVAMADLQVRHLARLTIDVDDLPLATGVPSRVEQIVVNLVVNAAQAPQADRPLHVDVRGGASATEVWIEVADNGRGMDAQTLEHALDPFFTTKAPGEGMGLGLSISHALARAMDGELTLRSAVGQGTVARVTVPRATTQPTSVDPAPPRATKENRRVLVVDDESDLRTMVAWALRPMHVVEAGSVSKAQTLLQTNEFDAIICDLMMPEGGGMALHGHIEKNHPELLSRCLFITGGAVTDQARAFLARDDVHCLDKPFRAAQLQSEVLGLE